MLALYVSATRLAHPPSTPSQRARVVGQVARETAPVFHMKRHKAFPQGMHGRYLEGSSSSDVGCIRPLANFHPTF